MWWSTAWPEHEVEAFVGEGERLGLGDDRGHVTKPQGRRRSPASCSSIPGEMSVAVSLPITPCCIRLSEK